MKAVASGYNLLLSLLHISKKCPQGRKTFAGAIKCLSPRYITNFNFRYTTKSGNAENMKTSVESSVALML